jgi:outer membrane protein assembly factor BamB
MRARTGAAVALAVGLLAGVALLGAGGFASGGTLTAEWVSDTARDNTINHHAVGAGGGRVVTPVSGVGNRPGLTDTTCSLVGLEPANGSVRWRASVSAADCFVHALTEPAVADADADGATEALAATSEDELVAYDARTGRREFAVSLPTYGYARPTVANLTPAPGPEVVAADIDGNLVVTTGEGKVLWRRPASGDATVWAPPVVDDADADGTPEVLLAGSGGIRLLNATGGVEWRHDTTVETIAYGQTDDDPAAEVIGAWTGRVVAIDGADGTVEWETSVEGTATVHDVGDADGDGTAEVYAGLTSQAVLALDAATGEREWRVAVTDGSAPMAPPVLADVDGDGTPEVAAAANDGTVAVLDPASGAELAAFQRAVPVWTQLTPADLDGADGAELLVRYGDGRVVALAYR